MTPSCQTESLHALPRFHVKHLLGSSGEFHFFVFFFVNRTVRDVRGNHQLDWMIQAELNHIRYCEPASLSNPRSPSSALLPFLGEGSPTKTDYRKKLVPFF